ncbi:hypothetical protein [Actinomadura sp. WMMB 499]|uniref:hypothetical protein n=1 Tax=Actinomadura sp. WMMB 499 TaxID=1219491 RepID=UPI001245CCE9|nr:hypothetical protein [Actinomadura sp. WMMB 499]QFG21524.1 hypothetical protein F7P10_10655 [Actinomadura sp. WMMB 499]
MKFKIATAVGLALVNGAAMFAVAVQPAQATDAGREPATAARCGGSLIDRKVARYQGKPIAELVVYYNRGKNCALLNHLGVTRGKRLRTTVFLAACKETRPSRACHFHGRPATEDGRFAYYAGPVSKAAGNRCIHAAGDIYFHGKRHLETSPAASHCR